MLVDELQHWGLNHSCLWRLASSSFFSEETKTTSICLFNGPYPLRHQQLRGDGDGDHRRLFADNSGAPIGQINLAIRSSAIPAARNWLWKRARLVAEPIMPT